MMVLMIVIIITIIVIAIMIIQGDAAGPRPAARGGKL